jgi:hypothetical protein
MIVDVMMAGGAWQETVFPLLLVVIVLLIELLCTID